MHLAEQETTITLTAADDHVRIWTCIPSEVRQLRKDHRFTEARSGTYDSGHEWAEFTIPRARWSTIRGGKGTRVLTDEQRAATAARLAAARKAR